MAVLLLVQLSSVASALSVVSPPDIWSCVLYASKETCCWYVKQVLLYNLLIDLLVAP